MTLHSETAGHGPHLLFIHGWGMHGGFWHACAQALHEAFTTTLIDLPGHGHSPRPTAPFTLPALAAAIAGLVREETTLIGWSLGGLLALDLARRFPRRIARLILVGGTARFCAAPGWPHAMAADTLAAFRQQLEQDPGRTLQRFLALQARGGPDARQTTRGLQALLETRPMAREQTLREGLAVLEDTDLRPALAHIHCPVLLIHGKGDAIIPCRAAQACGRLLPDAHLRLVADAGHAPFVSHGDAFVHAAREFCLEH